MVSEYRKLLDKLWLLFLHGLLSAKLSGKIGRVIIYYIYMCEAMFTS